MDSASGDNQIYEELHCSNEYEYTEPDSYNASGDLYENLDEVLAARQQSRILPAEDQQRYRKIENANDYEQPQLLLRNEVSDNGKSLTHPNPRQDSYAYAKYIKSTLGENHKTDDNDGQGVNLKLDLINGTHLSAGRKHTYTSDDRMMKSRDVSSKQDSYAKYLKSTLGETHNSTTKNADQEVNLNIRRGNETHLFANGKQNKTSDDDRQTQSIDTSLKQLSIELVTSPDEVEFDKMTTCPICFQMFTDPKMLPCLHTFCLNCLQQSPPTSSSDDVKSNSEVVNCPLCQISFQIPPEGLGVLPTNSLFARITGVRRSVSIDGSQSISVSSLPSTPIDNTVCTLCSEGDSLTDPPPAAFQCLDCNGDFLCTDCATAHRKQRMSKSHKLVTVGGGLSPSQMCLQHQSEPIESYCVNCSSPVCRLCFEPPRLLKGPLADLKTACQHAERIALSAMAQSSRRQLEEDMDQIKRMTDTVHALMSSIAVQRQTFLGQIGDVERQINETAQTAASIIEKNRQQLIDENNTLRVNTVRELDKLTDDIVTSNLQLDELRQLSCQLLKCGDDFDVAGLYGKLVNQRQHLQHVQARHDVSICGVKFISNANSLISERSNLLGKLAMLENELSDPYVTNPTIVHTYSGKKTIAGVTVLNQELYVIRDQQNSVEVYDAIAPFTGQRRLTIPGLRWPSDIAACPSISKVYIADMFGVVYIFDPSGNKFSKFQVDGEPQGLFVSATTVYVTCGNSRNIKEFTLDGETNIRTVRMQTDILRPYHTVPLIESGRYVLCHGQDSGKLHRVCVIDSSGKVAYCYGNANGSGSGRLDLPCHLSVDQFGYVMVVDRNNDRVVLLNPSLAYVRDLINRTLTGVKQPRRIWFDASSGLLYVGLLTGSVIVVRITNV